MEKTGAVITDGAVCIGCGVCVTKCPVEAIHLHPATGTAMKCDLCGGDPQYVNGVLRRHLNIE